MKKKIIGIFVCMLVISTVISVTNTASACTGFMAKKDNKVLAGHNEDWWDPDPYINIVPPKNGNQGYIYFECKLWGSTEGKIFAGVNDQGLFFDGYSTPFLDIVKSSDKPEYYIYNDHFYHNIQVYLKTLQYLKTELNNHQKTNPDHSYLTKERTNFHQLLLMDS